LPRFPLKRLNNGLPLPPRNVTCPPLPPSPTSSRVSCCQPGDLRSTDVFAQHDYPPRLICAQLFVVWSVGAAGLTFEASLNVFWGWGGVIPPLGILFTHSHRFFIVFLFIYSCYFYFSFFYQWNGMEIDGRCEKRGKQCGRGKGAAGWLRASKRPREEMPLSRSGPASHSRDGSAGPTLSLYSYSCNTTCGPQVAPSVPNSTITNGHAPPGWPRTVFFEWVIFCLIFIYSINNSKLLVH